MRQPALVFAVALACLLTFRSYTAGPNPEDAKVAVSDAARQAPGDEKSLPVPKSRAKSGGWGRFGKPSEAMDFYLMQRTGGDPIDYQYLCAVAKDLRARPKAVGDIMTWEALGPGNIGGRTGALLMVILASVFLTQTARKSSRRRAYTGACNA